MPPDSPANDALRLAGVSRNVETVATLDAAMAEFSTESGMAEAEVPDSGNV